MAIGEISSRQWQGKILTWAGPQVDLGIIVQRNKSATFAIMIPTADCGAEAKNMIGFSQRAAAPPGQSGAKWTCSGDDDQRKRERIGASSPAGAAETGASGPGFRD